MHTTNHLDLGVGRLAFDDTGGDGPLVLCVPGLGDLRSEYRHLRPLLVAAGHRVVTVDLRGHGESSTGLPDHELPSVGADVVALLDHLDVGDHGAVVVGCSLGAAATVWAAAERPDVVRGIALIAPFVRDHPTSPLDRLMVHLIGPRTWPRYLRSLHPTGGPEDLDEHLDALRANLRQPGRTAAVKAMARASKAPCEARIPEVRARSLVLMGGADKDFPDPRAEAELVADRLGGTAVVLDGLGHYPHAEAPASAAGHLVEFVEQACHAPG